MFRCTIVNVCRLQQERKDGHCVHRVSDGKHYLTDKHKQGLLLLFRLNLMLVKLILLSSLNTSLKKLDLLIVFNTRFYFQRVKDILTTVRDII